jgi:hypothetical protein
LHFDFLILHLCTPRPNGNFINLPVLQKITGAYKNWQNHFAATLKSPQIIRPSASDAQVYIFCKKISAKKILAMVIKTNAKNFILTAYLTNKLTKPI